MGSPFPGMNPYLENPATWPDLHSRLIVEIANELGPKVRPKYRVIVKEAVYKRYEPDQATSIGGQRQNIFHPSSTASPESGEVLIEESTAVANLKRYQYLKLCGIAI